MDEDAKFHCAICTNARTILQALMATLPYTHSVETINDVHNPAVSLLSLLLNCCTSTGAALIIPETRRAEVSRGAASSGVTAEAEGRGRDAKGAETIDSIDFDTDSNNASSSFQAGGSSSASLSDKSDALDSGDEFVLNADLAELPTRATLRLDEVEECGVNFTMEYTSELTPKIAGALHDFCTQYKTMCELVNQDKALSEVMWTFVAYLDVENVPVANQKLVNSWKTVFESRRRLLDHANRLEGSNCPTHNNHCCVCKKGNIAVDRVTDASSCVMAACGSCDRYIHGKCSTVKVAMDEDA
ncbi:hypothetical protein B484DRAFT_473907, partial [Ochromonadaceae sp. CCMP2298]